MKKYFLLIAIFSSVLVSCKKDDTQPNNTPAPAVDNGTETNDGDCIDPENNEFPFVFMLNTNIDTTLVSYIQIVRSDNFVDTDSVELNLIDFDMTDISTCSFSSFSLNRPNCIFDDFKENNGINTTPYGIPSGAGKYIIKIYLNDTSTADSLVINMNGSNTLGVGFGMSSTDTDNQYITTFDGGISFESTY